MDFVVALNLFLFIGGLFGFVLFIVVLLKLNKALNIWLARNRGE